MTLKDTCYIQHGRLTVYGDTITNGFPIILKCPTAELHVEGGTLSVPDNPLNEILIYPNPTTGNFTITFEEMDTPVSMDIFDSQGRKIRTTHMIQESSLQIDLSNQPVGLYFLRINQGNHILTKKVILIK